MHAVVGLTDVLEEDVPVPGQVEAHVGQARSNWATIHSSMNSLNDCLRCSSGV